MRENPDGSILLEPAVVVSKANSSTTRTLSCGNSWRRLRPPNRSSEPAEASALGGFCT